MTLRRRWLALLLVFVAAVLPVGLAGPAHAAVNVTRAEVSGDRLRIEGSAIANRPITVDGVQLGTSDGSGSFRIERSGYTPPADCTVDVNDGSATPTNARLSGCTVTAAALSSVSLSPSTVQGGATSTATVTRSATAPCRLAWRSGRASPSTTVPSTRSR